MSFRKVGKFINERLSLFVGVGIIISIHWGWYRLQQLPYLVPDGERKDMPLIQMIKTIQQNVVDGFDSFTTTKSPSETVPESK